MKKCNAGDVIPKGSVVRFCDPAKHIIMLMRDICVSPLDKPEFEHDYCIFLGREHGHLNFTCDCMIVYFEGEFEVLC